MLTIASIRVVCPMVEVNVTPHRCFIADIHFDERHACDENDFGFGHGSSFSCNEMERGDQLREGTGLILNQMEYIAGRNTRVRIVPANVPPMSV